MCGEKDTSLHRIIGCGAGLAIWEWTRERIAWILRTDPSRIPEEWILRLQFHIWPPQRHKVVLWILAHMVWFRMRERRVPSAQEYSDFLRRAMESIPDDWAFGTSRKMLRDPLE